ncbi:hypothetical protein AB685_19215 [Bacillus sp. LL01]|uniref:hypothetical protein n=1 Tax=Bacillus sp. LL01 TaxID=1665556 RepID=UPI00064D1CF6|nr:hypothetical protein [Bacillus sp. LL01]KMJ56857.1 hypothetical protein AB685_19215 [Bacillus sp. LL01]
MKKWVGSALIYLLIVIGGYSAYSFYAGGNEAQDADHGEHQNEDSHDEHGEEEGHDEEHGDHEEGNEDGHGDHGDHEGDTSSEVKADVELDGGELTITLTDLDGNPMDDLEVSHEKLMHLVVISEDLEVFQHLHPEKMSAGVFTTDAELEDGMYQAFVDIKPSELQYVNEPHPVMVGKHAGHEDAHVHLEAESQWTKEQGDYTVTLDLNNFSVKENVVLSFDIEGAEPENYLGALGHVVVVDEGLDEFIHVHPRKGTEPVFEAHFSKPGMYKLWAEFKLNGEVYAFPYVLEITE